MNINTLLSGRLKIDGNGKGEPENGEGTYRLALPDGSTVEEGIRGTNTPQETVAPTMVNAHMSETMTPVKAEPLSLTSPRYSPCPVKDVPLAIWYDVQADQFVVICPTCRRLISYDTLEALRLAMVESERKCCQGCRARISLERNPGLIGLYLDFWSRTYAWPQSPSWLEAISANHYNLWAEQLQAGLEAATAPLIPALQRLAP